MKNLSVEIRLTLRSILSCVAEEASGDPDPKLPNLPGQHAQAWQTGFASSASSQVRQQPLRHDGYGDYASYRIAGTTKTCGFLAEANDFNTTAWIRG
jgi:hypothetical protein